MRKLTVLLLTLCLMLSCSCAFAEGGTILTAGGYTFELTEGATITEQENPQWNICTFSAKGKGRSAFSSVNYELFGITYRYDEADISEQGVMDYQNFYILTALLFGQENMGIMSPSVSSVEMPDGQVLLYGFPPLNGKDSVALAHYNDGVGFMLVLTAPSADFADYTLKCIGEEIAQTAKQPEPGEFTVVITGDSAKVRTEASLTSGLIKTVYKGESIPMKGESGDFYIIDINGRTGYVHKGVSTIR